jgi:diguanylate cyclase (GGDEF)-like protein
MPPLADTATWIAVGFAVAAAALALGASLVLLAVVRRGGKPSAPAGAAGGGEPTAGRRDLADALEEAREESRRARLLSEIAATIDLDDVLQRTLAAAVEDAAVDAAMLSVHQVEDDPLVATVGMSAEEASRQPVATAPPGGARAVRISYRYAPDEEGGLREAGSELIQGGVAVPVREGGGTPVATLAVFWRNENRGPEEGEVARLEQLAATSAPAIRNAQRFREARELADVDGLTGLHNRRFFHETLGRECARAQRYDRRLALVVLDVDDFKETNDRVGHLASDSVLAAVADRLRRAVRRADLACRVGGDEFAVILPEAGARDAEQLYRRIQFAVGSGSAGPVERVRISAGIAELRPEDDPVSLFQRADDALYRAKQAGKGQVRGAGESA